MPYLISFVKSVEITDEEQYINDCCIGGDIVLAQILPAIRERYDDIQSNQEDWGWFAWFEKSGIKLAVDVFAEDTHTGEFQILLTSRKPRLLFGAKVQDTPELDVLRELVVSKMKSWPVSQLKIEHVNKNYMPG